MNLSIQQLSKATKLSISTIRVYASQRNLGKKIGNKRVFTQSDVQALLKGAKKSPLKKKPKAPAKKTGKKAMKAMKAEPIKAARPKAATFNPDQVAVNSVKVSFFSRLFGGQKRQQKVGLMSVKTTKQ